MVIKNIKIRFLAMAAIVLCGCFAPMAHVRAAETVKPDGAEWLVNEGDNHVWYQLEGTTLTIGGSGKMKDWNNLAENPDKYPHTPWYNKDITDIIIEEGITRVGDYSFYTNGSLESLKIADSVTEIGTQAIHTCSKLQNIEFGKGLEVIGIGNFYQSQITTLSLPEGLREVGAYSFQSNNKLAKIILPSTLTKIDQNSFNMGTTNALNEVISYAPIAPTLGGIVFKNVTLANLTIPSGSFNGENGYKTKWNIDDAATEVHYVRKFTAASSGIISRVVIAEREDLSGRSRECMAEPGKPCTHFDVDEWGEKYYISVEPDFFTGGKITSIKINGSSKEIAFPRGQNVYEEPAADVFNIEVEGIQEQHYNIMWANDGANVSGTDYDDPEVLLQNGSAKVVKVYDNATDMNDISHEIEHIDEGCLDPEGKGYVDLVEGNVVIFEFTPKYGYQLTSVSANGTALEAQETMNQYKYIMPATNIHFQATFTATEDVVKSVTEKVTSGTVTIGDGEIDAGSTVLSVKDAELDDAERAAFVTEAGDYDISNIFDIKLDQVFYKGSTNADDIWSKPLGYNEDLQTPAVITLKLDEGIDGNTVVIVHQKEGGEYETIETTYDKDTQTISFSTSSFSNFAIASKTLDVSDPTGEISFKENKFLTFLNTITFGLFFNENIEVTIAADDDTSVEKIEYIITDIQKTLDEVKAETNWKTYSDVFNISDEDKYIIYAKITDSADKVTYISTDGFVLDTTAPVINGLGYGNGFYYTTQKFTVDDSYIDKVLINGVETTDYVLPGNVDEVYEIDALDKAGNPTYLSIRMMSIDTIDVLIDEYTVENVTIDNKEDIEYIKDKVDSIDTTHATDEEKSELQAIADKCDEFLEAIKNKYIAEIEFTVTPPKADQVVGDSTFTVVSEYDNVIVSVKEWKINGGSETLPDDYVFKEDTIYIPILKVEVKNPTHYFDENTTLTIHGSVWGNGEGTFSLKDHRDYGYVKDLGNNSFLIDEMMVRTDLVPESEPGKEPEEEVSELGAPDTGNFVAEHATAITGLAIGFPVFAVLLYVVKRTTRR